MPLELTGLARLTAIDLDKSGAGADDQELKASYSLSMICGRGLLAYFDPALGSSLFNDTGEPRFRNMGRIKWKGSQRDADLRMETVNLTGVLLHKFSFEPLSGDKVSFGFVATAHPTNKQLADAADLLKTDIEIEVGKGGQPGLFNDAAPIRTSAPAPDVKPLKDALANAELALTNWPQANEHGEYSQVTEILNFKDETLHVNCWAKIKLLQTGPESWIGSSVFALPGGDEQDNFPLGQFSEQHPNRAAAIANEVEYLDELCGEWLKKNKRVLPAQRGAVTALRKWAKGLLLGGAPASVNEPEPKAKKARGKK